MVVEGGGSSRDDGKCKSDEDGTAQGLYTRARASSRPYLWGRGEDMKVPATLLRAGFSLLKFSIVFYSSVKRILCRLVLTSYWLIASYTPWSMELKYGIDL